MGISTIRDTLASEQTVNTLKESTLTAAKMTVCGSESTTASEQTAKLSTSLKESTLTSAKMTGAESTIQEDVLEEQAAQKWYKKLLTKCGGACVEKTVEETPIEEEESVKMSSVKMSVAPTSVKESVLEAASVKMSMISAPAGTANRSLNSVVSWRQARGTPQQVESPFLDHDRMVAVRDSNGAEHKFSVKHKGSGLELVEIDFPAETELEEVELEELKSLHLTSVRVSGTVAPRDWESAPGFSAEHVSPAYLHEMLRKKLVGLGVLSGENAPEAPETKDTVVTTVTSVKASTVAEEEVVEEKWYQRLFGKCAAKEPVRRSSVSDAEVSSEKSVRRSSFPSDFYATSLVKESSIKASVATVKPSTATTSVKPSTATTSGSEAIKEAKWYQRLAGKCAAAPVVEEELEDLPVEATSVLIKASEKMSAAPSSVKPSALVAASVKLSAMSAIPETASTVARSSTSEKASTVASTTSEKLSAVSEDNEEILEEQASQKWYKKLVGKCGCAAETTTVTDEEVSSSSVSRSSVIKESAILKAASQVSKSPSIWTAPLASIKHTTAASVRPRLNSH